MASTLTVLLTLLPIFFAFLAHSAPILPIKTGQIQLRLSSRVEGRPSQVFEVAQDYRKGDRFAFNVIDFKSSNGLTSSYARNIGWEIKKGEKQNRITLEVFTSSEQSYLIAHVHYILIGRDLDEKVIFLQNLRINEFSNIKHLDNQILLTTSPSPKFTSKLEPNPLLMQVFILYRGLSLKQQGKKSIINLNAYFIDTQHIHIHARLLNIIDCFITLMIINLQQIGGSKIVTLSLSNQANLQTGATLFVLSKNITIQKCSKTLSFQEEGQCWSMASIPQTISFKSTSITSTYGQEKDESGSLLLYGKNRLLSDCQPSSCSCGSTYPHATVCYEDNTCKCKIKACGAGYYTTASLVTSCTACPANLTQCITCAQQYGTTNVTCTSCNPGYVPLTGKCVACPTGCATCTTTLVNKITVVTCATCVPTLTLQSSSSIKICGCATNQFLNLAVSPVACVTCPTSCLTCTSLAVCTTCAVGYYVSGATCAACMPVCKTCAAAASCLTCPSIATLVGGVCTCPASTFFDIYTKTCLTCNTLQPNCNICSYSTAYSPASPSPVVCTTANSGYYIVANGSTLACVANCLNCDLTPTTVCSTCKTNFVFDGTSSCLCGGGLYYSTTLSDCIACSTLIPGCGSCQTNPIPTATTCLSCSNGYFTSSYPSLTCTACPSVCTICSSTTVCTGCISNLVISGTMCGCVAPLFFNTITQSCTSCSSAIYGCQTCTLSGSTVTCSASSPGFYRGTGNTVCFPCPSTCSTCSSATTCTACQSGYTLSSGSCICSTNCLDCLSNSTNTCSSCTFTPFNCLSCAVGYFSNLGLCTTCSPTYSNCLECTTTACLACASPFILDVAGCVCNITAGLYLSLNSSTCLTCSAAIQNCLTCSNSGSTTCSACSPGFYTATTQSCLTCTPPCVTCSLSSTNCLTCLVTYTIITPNTCGCDNTANLYYDPSTTGCNLCSTIIPNCQTCSTTGLVTTCTLCMNMLYWNSSTLTCDACSSSCTTCSSQLVCTGCPNNLVLSQTVGYLVAGQCVCDNSTLPLLYYDTASGTCQSCTYFYTTCTACFVSGTSVLCSSTSGSTYLTNSSTTANCPSSCATCDQAGCLSCPVGMTLAGSSCDCGSACTQCQTLSIGCTSCTVSAGAITSCSACIPGTYLASPNCLSCPSTCATCTSSTTCLTCQSSYVLIGGICSCPTTIGIFPNSAGVCTACSTIFYGCNECQISSGNTVCITCSNGYYLQGGQCLTCSSSCLTCAITASACTSCATGQTLASNGSCICSSAACLACNTISPNCMSCVYTIYGNFSKCASCQPDYYINGVNCSPCPAICQSCGAGGACLTCSSTFQVINSTCMCNNAQEMWQSGGICTTCSALYSNCQTCMQNTAVALNVSCTACNYGFFLTNNTCIASVCGDGLITSGQVCDDGNIVDGDGCSDFCQIQSSFACTGQPSICTVSINFFITLKSITTSVSTCNLFTISFTMYPVYTSYDSANFSSMLTQFSEASMTYLSWSYKGGVVSYTLSYSKTINKQTIKYYFSPSALGVSQTTTIPVIVVDVAMYSTNNIPLIYYDDSICKSKTSMQAVTSAVQYASYATLILSALPCKIVGLELFGVLQLAHINVGNMDNVNTLMTPLMGLKGVHGFTANLGQEGSKSRLLQSTTYTPQRVQSIGYQSNFLRNCNVMLLIVISIILVSLCLYVSTYFCQKCAPCLHSVSKRIIKEVLLTLILFNCFNFAYSAGIHFNYAPKDDSLYNAGTAAAVFAIVIPFLMAIGLMCSEDEGFGEYKEKFKPGLVERLYFVVTILYRTGIGLYISTSNEDSMSTLIVMALSIAFLLYNLVNLPYTKAYHNYRANVCHFTQCICLFVAMYYRSMMSSTSSTGLAQVYAPVYLEMTAIVLSLVVSMIVLFYEIYLFIKQCLQKKDSAKVSDGSSHANNEKHISEAHLQSFSNEKKFSIEDDDS